MDTHDRDSVATLSIEYIIPIEIIVYCRDVLRECKEGPVFYT